jgi:hypothetical protein
MSLSMRFDQQPRAWIVAEMALVLAVIGTLDFVTGYQFRLLPFYAVPIFVIAWFFGKKFGIATAFSVPQRPHWRDGRWLSISSARKSRTTSGRPSKGPNRFWRDGRCPSISSRTEIKDDQRSSLHGLKQNPLPSRIETKQAHSA